MANNTPSLNKYAAEGFSFSNTWFDRNIPVWSGFFCKPEAPRVTRILEIGSFEGQSAVWVLQNVLHDGGELHCVDTWEGGREHADLNMSEVEARFDANIQHSNGKATVRKHKGRSSSILAQMIADKIQPFDVVYIDGSHEAPDVMSDLVLAFQLCRVNGLVICDDYIWGENEDPRNTPKLAIDSFVNCYSKKLLVVPHAPLFQFYFQKIAN